MIKNNKGAEITDESHLWGQIAVQGPNAISLLTEVFHFDVSALGAFKFKILDYHSSPLILATTGYTGEKGAEIFVPAALVQLWLELLTKGEKYSVLPGISLRPTPRTEMKYSLYGHEIDDQTNPYAAELGWVIKETSGKGFYRKRPPS